MSEKTCEGVWNSIIKIIQDNVPPQSFKTWFEPIKSIKLDNKVLTIQVPSQFFYEWLEEHYVTLLKRALKQELGAGSRLEYNIIVENATSNSAPYVMNLPGSNNAKSDSQNIGVPLNLNPGIKNPFIIPGLKKVNIDSNLNSNLTFDNFIEGDCNRLARAAGLSVAAKPGGTSFNPLMIFSETGMGKTHLVQAIGNMIKQNSKNKIVLYVPIEKFTNQFVDSVKNNSNQDFLNFYQQVDVLIVDDVQFLENKQKTQEIFFTIFNHLHQQGKQLILTSDRAPKDLKGMDERLLSRFKWGLSADIQVPDFETRQAILEHMMYNDGINLHKDVVEYVAHNINTNVRELQGALVSLLAQASLNRKEVTIDLAKQILKNFVKNSSREISIEFIQKLVCDYFQIPVEHVKSKTRKREIVQARQISMFYAKDLTKSSLKTIGMHFGGRDHSTVIHACQTVNDLIETDKKFRADIEEIGKRIKMNLV
ncbi:MAG: chromosomal replication initiator protein DnaA [Bacteroidetes bacterium]|jgi:chromosomal replication initiator protein|nr:chromosomal replication initiator protein DnaA [Bacteroidota bacterium]